MPAAKTSRSQTIVFIAILMVTAVAYLPAMRGGFVWDDDMFVPKTELQSVEGLRRIWLVPQTTAQYYPLLYSSFWIQHRLWGDTPGGYHVVNLLLHLAVVSLVYLVLLRLEVPGALLAAGVFALHPVQVESVAWISEQKNTLSSVFYFSAVLAYLRFDRFRNGLPYFGALGFFILSLLSKTVTATLPAALLVIFWWKRGKLNSRRDVLPLIPFFFVAISAGLLSAYAEHQWVGAQGATYDLSFIQRMMLAGRIVWFYLSKLLWPTNLVFSYPRWEINPHDWIQWLYPLGVVALVIACWMLRRWSRAPLAALLFFVGTLFPALGFVNVFPFVYSYVADHFQYVASLGVIVLVAGGIARLGFNEGRGGPENPLGADR